MTNPQDPNQSGQPGSPAPQGWGQQSDPNQPGWAAPAPQAPTPAAAPGWGAPAQQPPAQPGWGAPPPAGPGWGAPPPAAPGWGAPMPPKKKGHGCLIAFIIVLVIFLVGVGSCVAFVAINVGPYVSTELNMEKHAGVKTVTFSSIGGTTTWVVTVKPGYESQASTIACEVKGDLQGTQFAGDNIAIVDNNAQYLATDALCP